jgi:hypothetical protein
MMKAVEEKDLVGKTIASTWTYPGILCLVFTDNTFVCVTGKSDYDGGYDPVFAESKESEELYTSYLGVRAGICSSEEQKIILEAEKAQWAASAEKKERDQYERLRRKFE